MGTLLRYPRFIAICFGLFFFSTVMLNEGGLWDEDEGAYAGFGLNMMTSGDWTIPSHDWSDVHRKTPLMFWAVAASFKVFGPNEFAMRLPALLAIWLTVAALYFMGKRLYGKDLALGAALVLSSSFAVPFLAKMAVTDGLLLLFETTAVLALLNYLKDQRWYWNAILWVSVALGLLVKGPPILILMGGLWVWLAIFHPDRKKLIGTHPWFYGLLALAPITLWIYLCNERDGGVFTQWLLDWYVLKRVGGSVFGQMGFPGYHLLVFIASFLPWFTFFPSALVAFVKDLKAKQPEMIAIAGWLVFGWLFYEAMSSALPTYSIAAQPALAVLIARQALAVELPNYKYMTLDKAMSVFYMLIVFLLAMVLLVIGYQAFLKEGMLKAMSPALVLWIASFTAVVGMYLDNRKELAVGAMIIGGSGFMFMLWLSFMPLVESSPLKGTEHTMAKVAERSNGRLPIVVSLYDVHMKQPSLAFYARRIKSVKVTVNDDVYTYQDQFMQQQPMVLVTDKTTRDEIMRRLKAEQRNFGSMDSVAWRDTDHKLELKYYYILVP